MTRIDIVSHVCNKLNQRDPTSVGICTGFVQRNYEIIYNATNWRDSEILLNDTVTTGNNTLNLNGTVARIASVRASGNRFLDPIDAVMLTQYDPTIFERTGEIIAYEEITDPADNSKKIKFYPQAQYDTPILIVGIRKCPSLVNDADSVILRGVDNCLIAYVEADMLERLRQYAKASSKRQEAQKLLQEAITQERQQANFPRRAKPLSVAGNTLSEMTDAVAARVSDWSPESAVLIREFIRRNYQFIYDAHLWKESVVVAKVGSDGVQVIMPEYIDRVLSIRSDVNLAAQIPFETGLYFSMTPGIFEQTGSPVGFSFLTPCAVKLLPPKREQLSIKSTNDADRGNVFIKGETAGIEKSETLVLNGLAHVETVNGYDVPLTISKLQSFGDIIVTGYTTGIELQRILADERERKHIRIWLQPGAGKSQSVLVLGKRRIRPLVQDEDTPILRDVQEAIIDAACGDMFRRAGQKENADTFSAKSAAAVTSLIDQERAQEAFNQRIVPYVEPDAGEAWFTEGGWMGTKSSGVSAAGQGIGEGRDTPIMAGAASSDIIFLTEKGTALWNFYEITVVYIGMGVPPESIYPTTVYNRTENGFTVLYNSPPPDDNYVLRWKIDQP